MVHDMVHGVLIVLKWAALEVMLPKENNLNMQYSF